MGSGFRVSGPGEHAGTYYAEPRPMPDTPKPASPRSSASTRLDSIDALRGIAALMVAGYHIWGHYGVYPFPSLGVVPQTTNADFFAYLVSPLRWGYLGVSLFLVLSGFCIHLPFARKRKETGGYQFDARQFYLRRMWRLYPAYAVSVIATFILLQVTSHGTALVASAPSISDLLTHLTLIHTYFDRYFYGIVTVYWSLALEFQLYLAYPLFLYLFRKLGLTRSIALLTIFSIVWRIISMDVFHHNLISVATGGPYSLMGFLFARMPEWLFGVWLAEWFVAGKSQPTQRMTLSFASIAVLISAILSTLWEPLWSLTDILFGLGFAFLVAAAITDRRQSHTAPISNASSFILHPSSLTTHFYRLLIWIGTISYSVYLFHMQLSWFGNAWIQRLPGDVIPFILRIVVFVLSIPFIAIIFRFLEAPFLKAPRQGDRYYSIYNLLRKSIGTKKDATIDVQHG